MSHGISSYYNLSSNIIFNNIIRTPPVVYLISLFSFLHFILGIRIYPVLVQRVSTTRTLNVAYSLSWMDPIGKYITYVQYVL